MSHPVTAYVILGAIILVLAVWALRGDKVKGAADARREAQAAERKRLGITDADWRLMTRARAFGLVLDTQADKVATSGQAPGRFTGSVMRVETEGQLTSRITVTRLVTFGVLALGARKKVDQRELYITIEGDGFQLVVKLVPTLGVQAREFAAVYNTRSGGMATQGPVVAQSGVSGELESLAKLHADGTLTAEEFAAAKGRLLGTAPAAQPAPQPEPEDKRG